ADHLVHACRMERAYLLSFTNDPTELSEAARIYQEIIDKRHSDAAAHFRFGRVARLRGDFQLSLQLFGRVIDIVDRGEDERINQSHWVYNSARLGQALTYWRIYQRAHGAEKTSAIQNAIQSARSVYDSSVVGEQHDRSVNDLLYYAYEERKLIRNAAETA